VTTPRMTAEAALGPALHTYATAATGPTRVSVDQMGFLDTLGSVFSGIVNKVPCLLGCGIPNALSLATQCGLDPVCWATKAPGAGINCIRQCLN
jgi:hypothetical protein